MNELSVKIYPSNLPLNEKEQRLREVLEFLLRSKKERGENKQVATERVAAAGNEQSSNLLHGKRGTVIFSVIQK